MYTEIKEICSILQALTLSFFSFELVCYQQTIILLNGASLVDTGGSMMMEGSSISVRNKDSVRTTNCEAAKALGRGNTNFYRKLGGLYA